MYSNPQISKILTGPLLFWKRGSWSLRPHRDASVAYSSDFCTGNGANHCHDDCKSV